MIYPKNELGIDPLDHLPEKYEGKIEPLEEGEEKEIKQNSNYAENGRPRIDNNVFFEKRSNPLSSKGD